MSDIPLLDRCLTPSERKRLFKRAPPTMRGHAGKPGSGPAGETCKTCQHLVRKRMSKVYLKCELTLQNWTGGAGTDVKAGDAACDKWSAKTE